METLLFTLIGALVGVITTYWFNLRQDKKATKTDLRLKASEELLDKINKFNSTLSNLLVSINNYIFNIQQYNQSIQTLDERANIPQPGYGGAKVVCIEDSIVRMYSDNINSDIQLHSKKWEEFMGAYNSFWSTFESKQVVLNEFTYIYDFILIEFNKLMIAEDNLISNHHMKIFSKVASREQITEDLLNQASSLHAVYKKQIFDMQCYLYDFRIELQNTYLSKIFNYEIPRRKPKDENLKVLTKDIKCERNE